MSNRNKKSKSPQVQQAKNVDKDLMKYLIFQKITKPQQVPAQGLHIQTQPDEDSEVEDFKVEIEMKFKSCKVNQIFKFPKEKYDSSSDASLQSLKDVTKYNLNCNNIDRLTDATQPYFMKALNERLSKLTDLIVDETSNKNKQQNYAPVLKSSRFNNIEISRLQRAREANLSSTSITRPIDSSLNAASQGRESVITKPPSHLDFRAGSTLSSEKKNKSKQVEQILKITQQKFVKQSGNLYKRTPQTNNNNYLNINSYINNSLVMKQQKVDIRIKTEQDEPDFSLNKYQIIPKTRSRIRESTQKTKKLDHSFGQKNLTIDCLDNCNRNSRSQNKYFKA